MISLALVLILIVGINFVFRTAADTVGAGQALNQINADAQSAQPVLFNDLNNVAKPPPLFIISSQFVTQFLNADDAKTSSDPNVIPLDNAGNYAYIDSLQKPPTYLSTAPEQYISMATLNSRNHRADMLKLIAHYLYPRRSGPDGQFFASDSSNDAYVEIGHAALPTLDQSAYYGPSELPAGNSGYDSYMDQNNPSTGPITGIPRIGAYASDWVLARRMTLMKDPSTIPTGVGTPPYTPNPANSTYDPYYGYGSTVAPPFQYVPPGSTQNPFTVNMAPLSYGSPDSVNTDTKQATNLFQSSRYDLAGITPENFDRVIDNAILGWQAAGYTGTSLWWNPLVYGLQLTQVSSTVPQTAQTSSPPYTVNYLPLAPTYNVPAPLTTDPGLWYARSQCNPTIQNPVTAASLAQMAPYFLQHCSQFVVEYTGDYLQQGPDGQMTGLGPDGQIDYYLDASGNKHIRWYGMPRSSTGVPHPGDPTTDNLVLIRGFDVGNAIRGGNDDPTVDGGSPSKTPLNYFTDVIPLRDYYTMYEFAQPTSPAKPVVITPPWEVDVNFAPDRDYGSLLTATAVYQYTFTIVNPPSSVTVTLPAFGDRTKLPRYVAAWHDDMPAMIRILIKVDDPNNKVKDGPWYEYVFKLK